MILLLLTLGCAGQTGADSGNVEQLDGSTASDAYGGGGASAGDDSGVADTGPVGEGNACQPGLYFFCVGPDGCYGQKVCLASGGAYGDCQCLPEDLVPAVEDPESVPPPPYASDPSIPLVNPVAPGTTFPGEDCPTRPDLAGATPCSGVHDCSYGHSCWWEARCEPIGVWSAAIPFC